MRAWILRCMFNPGTACIQLGNLISSAQFNPSSIPACREHWNHHHWHESDVHRDDIWQSCDRAIGSWVADWRLPLALWVTLEAQIVGNQHQHFNNGPRLFGGSVLFFKLRSRRSHADIEVMQISRALIITHLVCLWPNIIFLLQNTERFRHASQKTDCKSTNTLYVQATCPERIQSSRPQLLPTPKKTHGSWMR